MARPCLSLYIDARGRTVLHRSGFSWLALLAVPLWALQRRAWALLALSLPLGVLAHGGVNALLDLLPSTAWQNDLAVLWLLLESGACGCWAHRVHRAWLLRRGYRLTASEMPALWPAADPAITADAQRAKAQADAQADAQANAQADAP